MAKWFLGFNGPVLLAGLFVAGCESPAPQVPPDSYRPPTPAEQACVNQGFVRGSDGYDQCMARENAAGKPPPPLAPPSWPWSPPWPPLGLPAPRTWRS